MDGELRFLTLPYNLASPLDRETTKRISTLRKSLISKQNWSGSFGGPGTLEEVVTTSQVILALATLGDHRDIQRVRSAFRWLASTKVANGEYSYWSLAPFNAADGYGDDVIRTFEKANALATANLKHHPNSPLPNFVVEHAAILDFETEFTKAENVKLANWFSDTDSLKAFPGPLISHATLVATVFGICKAKDLTEVNLMMSAKAESTPDAVRWPGNIASTCYVLMNLIAIKSISCTHIFDEMIEKSYGAIIYAHDHKEVLSTLPAGGDFQKPALYTNALVLRAVTRYWTWKKKWRQIGVYEYDRNNTSTQLLWLLTASSATLTIVSWWSPSIIEYARALLVTDDSGTPNYWETLDRIANVIGVLGLPGLAVFALSLGKIIYDKLR